MIEKKKILIVDDDPDITRICEKFLNLAKFDTIICNNGKEALEIIEKKHEEIALILLDIMMPGPDGYSVLEEIKRNEKFNDISVVMFTVLDKNIEKARNLGADGYLIKPFPGKELIKYVQGILNA